MMLKEFEKYGFWKFLSEKEKEGFAASTREKHYCKGEIVHSPEEKCEGIILVLSGGLRTYILSDEGREVTLYRLRPGEVCVLSASCVLDAVSFDVFIEASENTDVYLTDVAAFKSLSESNINVRCYGYEQASARFSDIMWSMQQMLFMRTDRRIAAHLLKSGEEQGSMIIAETQEQIASSIGTAREVVSRILKIMAEEGMVRLFRGGVEIIDPEKLRDMK